MPKKPLIDRRTARRQFLGLRPLRNPKIEWADHQGRALLTIPRPKNWKIAVVNLFFPVPESRDVALDAIGSDVWRLCDGQHTIAQISQKLGAQYKLGQREIELSLQQFFKDLGRRGYIGFVTEKPAVEPKVQT